MQPAADVAGVDTAFEITFLAIGVAVAVLFVALLTSACLCGRDANWQERFDSNRKVAYLGEDDRWHAGVREPTDGASFWTRLRGEVPIRTKDDTVRMLPSDHVIDMDNLFQPKVLRHCFSRRRAASDISDGTRPVFGNLMRAHTPLWAFVLNNTIVALSTALGFEVRIGASVTPTAGFFIIFGITFLTGTAIMCTYFLLFGFGEALIDQRAPKVLSNELAAQVFGSRMTISNGEAVVVSESNQSFAPRLKYNFVSKIYLDEPRKVDVQIKSRRPRPAS